MYFGCRQSNSDYIYKSEISEFKDTHKVLNILVEALSRETGQEKKYVQDKLKEDKDQIVKAINEEGAHIYLCGSTQMGTAVQTLLKEVLGEERFKQLEKEKKLVKELWG